MLRTIDLCISCGIISLIRIIEKSYDEFNSENIPYSFIYHRNRNRTLIHKFTKREDITIRTTECAPDIQASHNRLIDRLFHIFGNVMLRVQILHGIRIRHYITFESEIIAESVCQPVRTSLNRGSVIIVI